MQIILSCIGFSFYVVPAALHAQKVNEYFFEAGNGINLFVKELGREGNPKIIFLHGGAGDNHLNFFPHFNQLSKSYHLIFYDQTDAGKSFSKQKPEYSIMQEVENLERLRVRLSIDKLNLIGHSWGSILALSYAKKYPLNVNKMLLTGSIGVDASYYQLFAQKLQKVLTKQEVGEMQQLIREGSSRQIIHEKIMLPHYFSDTGSIIRMTRTLINFEVNLSIAKDILKRYDVKPVLPTFKFPVLVVQGRQDILTINDLLPGFRELPFFQFKEIDSSGHWVFVEQPRIFRKLVKRFFDS